MGTQELTAAVPLDDDEALLSDAATDAASAEAAAAGTDSAAPATDDGAAAADAELDPEALAALVAEDESARRGAIPPERLNEMTQRAKRAEAEAEQLRQTLLNITAREPKPEAAATPLTKERDFESEFAALQEQYDKGEVDDAQLRREERKLIRDEAEANALKKLAPLANDLQAERDRIAMERLQGELNAESAKAFAKYPFLNHKADDHNAEAIALVLKERDELIQSGVAPAKALRLAVAAIAPDYADAQPSAAAQTPDQIAAARLAKARKAASEADGSQPPTLAGMGTSGKNNGTQRLSASVKDHDKWEKTPEPERGNAFTA